MKNNNRNFKEPVRLREKPLKDGSKSLYLDIYVKGERTREYLKLYLIPEIDQGAKMQNKETLKAANAIKSQRIIELTQEKAGIPKSSSRSKMLLIDYMKAYSKRKLENGTSDAFHKQIEKAIKHLIKYRGAGITMQEVDKDYCLGFIDYLNHAKRKDGKIMAKVTTGGYLRCLNCALNQAVRDDIIPENPILKIDSDQRIKIPESTREYLTLEEVKILIDAPCRSTIVKQAFLFSCFTGLRIGDVQKLKWSDISKEGNRYKVKIVMNKTKRTLYQPLGKEAVEYLPERGNAPENGFVFQLPSTLNRTLKLWVHDCGIHKNITYHSARHTYATMLLTIGIDLYTVSKLLGHTQVKTTQIYAKVIDQKKDEAIDRLDGYFGDDKSPIAPQLSGQGLKITNLLINADNNL